MLDPVLQEVPNYPFPVVGHDRLRVVLNTLNRIFEVAHPHYLLVVHRERRHLQAVGETLLFYHEGVVTGGFERNSHPVQHPPAVVDYPAGLPVHEVRGADDLTPEYSADALVAQAYTQRRNLLAHRLEDRLTDSKVVRVLRVPRAGGDDYAVWLHRLSLLERDLVVPEDLRRGSELAHVLCEVVDERVVVVDDEDFHLLPPAASTARKR